MTFLLLSTKQVSVKTTQKQINKINECMICHSPESWGQIFAVMFRHAEEKGRNSLVIEFWWLFLCNDYLAISLEHATPFLPLCLYLSSSSPLELLSLTDSTYILPTEKVLRSSSSCISTMKPSLKSPVHTEPLSTLVFSHFPAFHHFHSYCEPSLYSYKMTSYLTVTKPWNSRVDKSLSSRLHN